MAVKMLACMSSKNMEESVEVNYEKENELKTPTRSVSKSNLRKTKSFTCQTLIHPSWSFKSQGNHSRELSRDRNRDESITPPLSGPQSEEHEDVAPGKPGGKGWKSFFSALQCSRTPLRSTDVRSLSPSTTSEIVFFVPIWTCHFTICYGLECKAGIMSKLSPRIYDIVFN